MSGGDLIFGELARGWHKTRDELQEAGHAIAEHLPHRGEHPYGPPASQAPAAQPVNVEAATAAQPEGEPMSLTAADLREFADHVEKLGEEGLAKAEQLGSEALGKAQAIVASPAAAEGFDLLHTLTGINVNPAIVTQALGSLRAIVQAYAGQATAPAAPEQPAEVPAA